MTKEELYAEYCIEYPMVQGYREVTYECWLEKQVIDSRAEAVNENAVLRSVSHSTIEKPPIGLKPKWLHDEQRQREIKQAIERYINAGRKIPQEWLDEYNSYCG